MPPTAAGADDVPVVPAARAWRLLGVDFTSAPRQAKPIVAAHGRLDGACVVLERIETLTDWTAFEALLTRDGPWLGAFDFPFGLPREASHDLGWPQAWPALVAHCAGLGRPAFRAALDVYRETRPIGSRYAHRATDHAARSHSPLKLVNPPVGLMFLEGAPRLLAAGVSLPAMHEADPHRVAVEAYPGLLARAITAQPYKSDERRKQTPARAQVRKSLVDALRRGEHPLGKRLDVDGREAEALVADAGGDRLDAVLALMQAAWCLERGAPGYGLPADVDPLEGWIATAPPSSAAAGSRTVHAADAASGAATGNARR